MEHHFRVRAIVFDLDGVLVDSMPAIRRYWIEWGQQHGIRKGAVLEALHLPGEQMVRTLAPNLDAIDEARQAALRYEIEGIPAMAGARRLLDSLPRGTWAVVTSGARDVALRRLAAAELPRPQVLITADDAPRGKPDPTGYILAALRLRLPPSACLAIEDAPAGIAAARRAGMAVIALSPLESDLLPDGADAVIASLESMHVAADPDGAHVDVSISER